ncbi:hypothetical protein GI584_09675 [Gracilibacillus salitolerans]|uniref:Uncharacterized protein n=1 Tax=Gracilibacillus salitolerans TaxID=2663022 RepID=A0A5Q2TJM0_9BACI|nr:hypothetical protein [Gracilibacillus salitolerans]QGH34277.1 hypothetical protein GI584_09675 [Gracilibacillus salitolerans]
MFRKFMSILILSVVFFVVSISFASAVEAENFGPYRFTTDDGRWDGKLYARSGQTVYAKIDNWSYSRVSVRLCSSQSGNCTSFKTPTWPYGSVTFTNMASGTYYGDVISHNKPYAAGEITFTVLH